MGCLLWYNMTLIYNSQGIYKNTSSCDRRRTEQSPFGLIGHNHVTLWLLITGSGMFCSLQMSFFKSECKKITAKQLYVCRWHWCLPDCGLVLISDNLLLHFGGKWDTDQTAQHHVEVYCILRPLMFILCVQASVNMSNTIVSIFNCWGITATNFSIDRGKCTPLKVQLTWWFSKVHKGPSAPAHIRD